MNISISNIELIVKHITKIRNHTSPKTSYNTSGTSSSVLNVYVDSENLLYKEICTEISLLLIKNKEFDRISNINDDINKLIEVTHGHCILVYGRVTTEKINLMKSIFINHKTKLVIFIDVLKRLDNTTPHSLSLRFPNNFKEFKIYEEIFDNICVASFYNYKKNTQIDHNIPRTSVANSNNSIGFNHQPSVSSQSQFYYLWNNTSQQQESGKDRVLQRLAEKDVYIDTKNVTRTQSNKFSTKQWDELIHKALIAHKKDYDIYDTIRKYTLGTTLAEDSLINNSNNNQVQQYNIDNITSNNSTTAIIHHQDYLLNYKKSANNNTKKSTTITTTDETNKSIGGDGRAIFMVERAIECIPNSFLQRISPKFFPTPVTSGSNRKGAYMLDYGCAEGAITAALGKELGLSPNQIIGADVRTLPSDGFTFIQLASEDPLNSPTSGTILPTIRDHSIDLVTASMVFHHVTHIKAVLLELRRIIATDGLLLMREHHCTSPDMGAFLDITHGLYSLSWSNPIEWPAFIEEYQAYYRSQDQWNDLLSQAGFTLCIEELKGTKDSSYYHSITRTQSKIKATNKFPNVIKAYYAIYRPTINFKLPSTQVVISQSSSNIKQYGITSDIKRSLKRSIVDTISCNNDKNISIDKKVKFDDDNNNNNNNNNIDSTSEEVLESKKYPGRFYKINKITGSSEWIS